LVVLLRFHCEFDVCEFNYDQLCDVLEGKEIVERLPIDDQLANVLEGISENSTIQHGVVLEYRLNSDGTTSGTITITLEKGDVVNTE